MGLVEVAANVDRDPRDIPMHSLTGQGGEGRELAVDRLFLKEVVRQTTMFNVAFERAWLRAVDTDTPYQDLLVLADVQSALFAAIITRRILRPERVRKHPQHSNQAASQQYADERGLRLRMQLGINESSPIFAVTDLRNSYEHIDERIDALSLGDAASLSDWSISDGKGFRTIRESSGVHHRLRVFYPAAGVLFYDDEFIDMYHLDLEMMSLRSQAESAIDKQSALTSRQSWLFGGSQVVHLVEPKRVQTRHKEWLDARAGLGGPIKTEFVIRFPELQ